MWLHIAGTNEPKSAQQATQGACFLLIAYWVLFGSLVPAMCNHTSSAQVHELPQNQEGTLFS